MVGEEEAGGAGITGGQGAQAGHQATIAATAILQMMMMRGTKVDGTIQGGDTQMVLDKDGSIVEETGRIYNNCGCKMKAYLVKCAMT